MKQEELKHTLGRIRPSEALIRSTMRAIDEQRDEMANGRFHKAAPPIYKNPRVLSAVCACMLLLVVGFVSLRMTNISTEPSETVQARYGIATLSEGIVGAEAHGTLDECTVATVKGDEGETLYVCDLELTLTAVIPADGGAEFPLSVGEKLHVEVTYAEEADASALGALKGQTVLFDLACDALNDNACSVGNIRAAE